LGSNDAAALTSALADVLDLVVAVQAARGLQRRPETVRPAAPPTAAIRQQLVG
jgi:hypothetical protein